MEHWITPVMATVNATQATAPAVAVAESRGAWCQLKSTPSPVNHNEAAGKAASAMAALAAAATSLPKEEVYQAIVLRREPIARPKVDLAEKRDYRAIANITSWYAAMGPDVRAEALLMWETVCDSVPISRIIALAHGFSLPLAKTSKSLLVKNGKMFISVMAEKPLAALVAAMAALAPRPVVADVGAHSLGGIDPAHMAGEFLVTHPALYQALFVAALVLLGYMLYWAVSSAYSVAVRFTRSVKTHAGLFYANNFGIKVERVEMQVGVRSFWHNRSVHYLIDTKTGEEIAIESTTTMQPPACAPRPSSPPQQEQAVIGSEFTPLAQMPRYLVRIYVEKVFRGMGFRLGQVICTATHLFKGIEDGHMVTIVSSKGTHSFNFKTYDERSFLDHDSYIDTPFPDVCVIPLLAGTFSKLDLTSVRVKPVARKCPMQVFTIGTTALDSELRVYVAAGLTDGVVLRGLMEYASSTEKGFSGSPVITGKACVSNPFVVAVHQASGNTNTNHGFLLSPVDQWLQFAYAEEMSERTGVKKPSEESSDQYFLRTMRDRFDDLKHDMFAGRWEDSSDGSMWFEVGQRNLFRMSKKEFDLFEDAPSAEYFETHWSNLLREEMDMGISESYRDRETEERLAEREEKEEMRTGKAWHAQGMRGESAAAPAPSSTPALAAASSSEGPEDGDDASSVASTESRGSASTANHESANPTDLARTVELESKQRKLAASEIKAISTEFLLHCMEDMKAYVAKQVDPEEIHRKELIRLEKKAENEKRDLELRLAAQKAKVEAERRAIEVLRSQQAQDALRAAESARELQAAIERTKAAQHSEAEVVQAQLYVPPVQESAGAWKPSPKQSYQPPPTDSAGAWTLVEGKKTAEKKLAETQAKLARLEKSVKDSKAAREAAWKKRQEKKSPAKKQENASAPVVPFAPPSAKKEEKSAVPVFPSGGAKSSAPLSPASGSL